MVLCARCRTCNRAMEHKLQCPALLGCHVVRKHPCTNISHFTCKLISGQSNEKKSCKKNKNLKKTVECWKPGCSCLHCSTCNREVVPIVRRHTNKITRTIFGALFVLGCWPMCFLPYAMGVFRNALHLYCPKCLSYLGVYKRRSGVVILEIEKEKSCCIPNVCVP